MTKQLNADTQNEKKSLLTTLEIFLILFFGIAIAAFVISTSITVNNQSTIRLDKYPDDKLWLMIEDVQTPEHLKIEAFESLTKRNNSENIIEKVYELVIENQKQSPEVFDKLISYLSDNPNLKLSKRISKDFLLKILPEKIWNSIKISWAPVLLNDAFSNANLLFEDKSVLNDSLFNFVVEILSINCHKHLFDVLNTYFQNSKVLNDSKKLKRIIISLDALPLVYSEDVLNTLSLMIKYDFGYSKEFKGFADRVYFLIKRFGKNAEANKNLKSSLEELKKGRWLEFKKQYVELLDEISESED